MADTIGNMNKSSFSDMSYKSSDQITNSSSARYGDDFTNSQLARDTISTSINITESKELISALSSSTKSSLDAVSSLADKSLSALSLSSSKGGEEIAGMVKSAIVGMVVVAVISYLLKGK